MPQKHLEVKCSLLQGEYILDFLMYERNTVLVIDPNESNRLKEIGRQEGGKVISANLDIENGLWELTIEIE